MNDDRDKDKDYQIMELKQKISYYEPFKQKYEDLKEDWKYIKSLLDKEFNERTRLKKENEQLHYLKLLLNGFIVEKGLEKEYVKWVTQVKKEILKEDNLKNVLIQTDKIISNHLETHTSGCKCCKCKHFEQELCYKGHIVPYFYFCNDYSGD